MKGMGSQSHENKNGLILDSFTSCSERRRLFLDHLIRTSDQAVNNCLKIYIREENIQNYKQIAFSPSMKCDRVGVHARTRSDCRM